LSAGILFTVFDKASTAHRVELIKESTVEG